MTQRIQKAPMFLGLLAALAMGACDDGDADGAGGSGGIIVAAGGEGGAGGGADMGMGEGGAGGAVESAVQSLSIAALDDALAGAEHRYVVTVTFEDGTTGVPDAVTWSSTNDDIVSFADGVATFPYGGSATITATVGDVTADLEVTVGCDYPRFPANIILGKALAPVTWDSVMDEQGNSFPFSLRDASCSVDYKAYDAFLVIVNAEWCPPCQAEIRDLAAESDVLEELGAKIVFITLQNQEGGPIDSRGASRFVSRYGDDLPSIRAGVIGSNPEQFFNNPALIQAFPTSFVVRKRDMQVIADSRGLQYSLHPLFPLILADLEADWSDPRANIMFASNCEEGGDEASEPNDMPGQAQSVNVGDAFSGGICTAAPDYFRIEAEGDWTFTVEFTHATGDIDMAFAGEDGRPLADREGATSGDDNEVLQGSGPALIRVYGYGGASAPYNASLTAR
ncbi:MAG: thiol-disulfide isomerase/thioredoxin [Bradymonadia bacterium]|jgi:thiol-disulfide isomerase/thioredoxin